MLPVASGQAQGIRLLPVLKRWRLTREMVLPGTMSPPLGRFGHYHATAP
jgi:hypothetical protein